MGLIESVGPVLGALAKHLHIEPTKLFDWVSSLPPDQVIDFVHAMHGVDPDKEGHFKATSSNDAQVDPATRKPGIRGGWSGNSPHSLTGLATWLAVNGYTTAGVAAACPEQFIFR